MSGSYSASGYTGITSGATAETVAVDGYGTLTTKSGTFHNVLRMHISQTINDTSSIAGSTSTVLYQYETYSWVSQAYPGVTLASISHMTYTASGQTRSADGGTYSQVSPLGIDALSGTGVSEWTIAPQPAADHATVMVQSDRAGADMHISIQDMSGRLMSESSHILTADRNDIQINVSDLAEGIYTVTLKIDGRTDTHKLAVRH